MPRCLSGLALTACVLALILGTRFAGADLSEEILRQGLTQKTTNAICEAMLITDRAAGVGEAMDLLRRHRRNVLGAPIVQPRVYRNLRLTDQADEASHLRLAAHIRGIEAWARRADPANPNAPRTYALTLTGVDAIEGYDRALRALRDNVTELAQEPEHARGQRVNLARVYATTGLFGSIYLLSVVLKVPIAFLLPSLPFAGPLVGSIYTANRFRFVTDLERNWFDEHLETYLNADPDQQRTAWLFSSRTYQLIGRVVDAIAAKDRRSIGAAILNQQRVSTLPLLEVPAAALERLALGQSDEGERPRYVLIDSLLDYDPRAGAPRLVIVLRTSATKPSKVFRAADVRSPSLRALAPAAN